MILKKSLIKWLAALVCLHEDARVLADVRLSQNRSKAFFKAPKFAAAKPESAQHALSEDQMQVERHPLESVDLEVSGSGESIFSICKKYISLVSANSCFDYFLEQLPVAEQ